MAAIFLIVFAGISAGNNSSYLDDLSGIKVSAEPLFEILKMEDEDQIWKKSGSKGLKDVIRGNISFENVSFTY